jgi:UDP-N-acetylmuramoyl-tripeptide--D-alanyl-D-alanine ligase
MTLGEIAMVVDGHLDGDADRNAVVTGPAAYDSRLVEAGGLFLAFVGEHADGHDFAADALAAGAVAVMGTRSMGGPAILVNDLLTAVAALAAHVRTQLEHLTVVGITGSSGKTTTKDLLAGLLAEAGSTVAPAGSSNNELGLPVTILRADRATRFLVLEMGARGIGHIDYLTAIARPQIGVVLNVGSAHLGEFGSRDAIARAKGELVEALPVAAAGGLAVLNADDPFVTAMRTRTGARVVTAGESAAADVRAEAVELGPDGRARFELVTTASRMPVTLQLAGEHQVANALAAAAVALECGRRPDQVAAGLSAARPQSRWRMEITERADGVTVVNDAYNANPESMRAALKTLAIMAKGRRSVAVLGPMAELGAAAGREHDALGRLAVRLDIAALIAVGEAARPIAQGAALEGSWNGESEWVPDVESAIARLGEELRAGDVVLVKASRSAGLERIAAAMLSDEVGPAKGASG